MTSVMPPAWAERVLRLVVRHDHFANVAGDLLEAYRDTIHPARGRRRADRWYVGQVAQFVWLAACPWAILFSLMFVSRTAIDWLAPTDEFKVRAAVTTGVASTIVAVAALRASVRCRSVASGILAGVTCVAVAAPFDLAGVMILLGVWHDAATLAAIRNSGGLLEALTLPLLMTIPAAVIGGLSGLAGAGASAVWYRWHHSTD
jgi:hypothetical protein